MYKYKHPARPIDGIETNRLYTFKELTERFNFNKEIIDIFFEYLGEKRENKKVEEKGKKEE